MNYRNEELNESEWLYEHSIQWMKAVWGANEISRNETWSEAKEGWLEASEVERYSETVSEMSVNEIKWIQSANGAVWFIDLIHECNEGANEINQFTFRYFNERN